MRSSPYALYLFEMMSDLELDLDMVDKTIHDIKTHEYEAQLVQYNII